MDVVFCQVQPPSQMAGELYVDVSETLRDVPDPLQLSKGISGETLWLETIPIIWNNKLFWKMIA